MKAIVSESSGLGAFTQALPKVLQPKHGGMSSVCLVQRSDVKELAFALIKPVIPLLPSCAAENVPRGQPA